MNFKELTDDLVSRLSIQIAALLGFLFCWTPILHIQMLTKTTPLNIPPALATVATCIIATAYIFYPIFFHIENTTKGRVKFPFLKNKFIKFTILVFATIFAISILILASLAIYFSVFFIKAF